AGTDLRLPVGSVQPDRGRLGQRRGDGLRGQRLGLARRSAETAADQLLNGEGGSGDAAARRRAQSGDRAGSRILSQRELSFALESRGELSREVTDRDGRDRNPGAAAELADRAGLLGSAGKP